MGELFANSGDPDQISRSVASDMGLHCLPVTHLGVSSLQWVKLPQPRQHSDLVIKAKKIYVAFFFLYNHTSALFISPGKSLETQFFFFIIIIITRDLLLPMLYYHSVLTNCFHP